eukprot:scaffold134293_cov26-Tisochrysis_lutea.AAC.1
MKKQRSRDLKEEIGRTAVLIRYQRVPTLEKVRGWAPRRRRDAPARAADERGPQRVQARAPRGGAARLRGVCLPGEFVPAHAVP